MAGVTPEQIYQTLLAAGASTVQAIGIMANMINESSLDPEAIGDGGTSFGLVQDHGAYSALVTGNPVQDMKAQVNNMVARGGLRAAAGSTPQQVAGNFAANYEICVGCQPGGAQYNGRVANVATVAGWVASGSWPQASASGATSAAQQASAAAQLNAQSPGAPANCAWNIAGTLGSAITAVSPITWFLPQTNPGGICILTNSQARAIIGASILMAGVGITVVGLAAVSVAVSLAVGEKLLTVLPGVGKGTGLVRSVTGGGGTRTPPARRAPAPPRPAPAPQRTQQSYTAAS